MAKSSRATTVKKNNQRLKKHVFGPVETARNERLSAKLLELASQPKPPRTEMEVEQSTDQDAPRVEKTAEEDVDMDADASTSKSAPRSNNSMKKQRAAKAARVDKKRHRRVRNAIVFPLRHLKGKGGKKRV